MEIKDNRTYLQKNSFIKLYSPDFSRECDFEIESVEGAGSSCVCYKAKMTDTRGNAVPGILKEFYPVDMDSDRKNAFSLYRDTSADDVNRNQLRCADVSVPYFTQARDIFVKAYSSLEQVRLKNKQLFSPISTFYLLRGLTGDGNFTYYVWMPYDGELMTFCEYLKAVCSDMVKGKNKTEHLKMILETVKNLAGAVNALHSALLLHLDITPGNFGIKKIVGGVSSEVSLIDVNTFHPMIGGGELRSFGTGGFRSPYLRPDAKKLSVKFDIFSIGACLFNALVMEKTTDENGKDAYDNCLFVPLDKEYVIEDRSPTGTAYAEPVRVLNTVYFKERYNSIESLISASPLFRDSVETEDRLLQRKICDILKKCLTLDENEAYEGVNLLVDDLKEALSYFGLVEGGEILGVTGEKHLTMQFDDKQEYISGGSKLGAAGAMWNLLYDYPLYKFAKNENGIKKVNILVLGLGAYASRFVDIAFQLSQIPDFEADITVVSNEIAEDKKHFLGNRPEFCNYFEVDSEKAAMVPDAPYGKISFLGGNFSENSKKNKKELKDIAALSEKQFDFCFTALHSDKLNLAVSKAARDAFSADEGFLCAFMFFGDKDKNGKIQIESELSMLTETDCIVPVDVNMTVDKNPDYKLLDRMAFNVHLVWTGTLENTEYSKKKFTEVYNWNSSFSNAVSMKYKLYSMGLDMSEPDFAAREFLRKIDDDKTELQVMYEHRRWNAELIANGWKCMPKESYDTLKTATKDKRNKLHPCLVPSEMRGGAKSKLSHSFWIRNRRENWNCDDEEILNLLDPLDRVSVELHRSFHRRRHEIDAAELFSKVNSVYKYLDNDALCSVYNAFSLSVNALLEDRKIKDDGSQDNACVNSYKYHHRVLRHYINTIPSADTKKEINKIIDEIDNAVFPALEDQSYTDFKKKDEALIRNIPFILTYTPKMHLLVPLVTESYNEFSTTRLFNNVAAAIMTAPKRITYVVSGNALESDYDSVKGAFDYVKATLENHMIPSKISILVISGEDSGETRALTDKLMTEAEYLYSSHILYCPFGTEHMMLQKYLSEKSSSRDAVSAIQMNDCVISGYLSGCMKNAHEFFPCFRFDSVKQEFSCSDNCRYLTYIPFRASMKSEDMFVSKGKNIVYEEPELQKAYKALWNIYKSEPGNKEKENADSQIWHEFCSLMRNYSDSKSYNFSSGKDAFVTVEKTIPVLYKESFIKLMTFFKNVGIAGEFGFSYVNSYLLKFTAEVTENVRKNIDRILVEYKEDLLSPHNFSLEKRGSTVYIQHGNLFFNNIDLSKAGEKKKSIIKILDSLSGAGLITGYKNPSGQNFVSFMCSSNEVKKLITTDGYLFEVYCYYSLIETGFFDEVRTSLTVSWNDMGLANEIDIIAIKNFRTVLIECKTEKSIEQEFYNKLFALKNIFGVNSAAVLIADLCASHEASNAFQSKRGDAYGIRTITSANDIMEIEEIIN